jgi:hypothetical protein
MVHYRPPRLLPPRPLSEPPRLPPKPLNPLPPGDGNDTPVDRPELLSPPERDRMKDSNRARRSASSEPLLPPPLPNGFCCWLEDPPEPLLVVLMLTLGNSAVKACCMTTELASFTLTM